MRRLNARDYILFAIMMCILSVFVIKLGYYQIVKGEEYAKAGESVASKIVTMKAARGEILDRNGTPLVMNRQGNAIVFYDSDFPEFSEEKDKQKIRNDEILALVNLFEANDAEWIDELPLEINESGQIAFKEDTENEQAILKSKDMLHLNSYATAQNCMDALIERYSLQDYSQKEQIKIASVCYNMLKKSFNAGTPYTFADNVSDKLVSIVKENSRKFPGVEVEVVTYREYKDGTIAPHIIGMYGPISAEEYAEKSDTYSMTDDIGKSGIEYAYEEELKGTDGYKTIYTDSDGNTTTEYTKDPVQGNSVVLTLDYNLQKVAQKAIKDCLDGMANEIVGTDPAGSVVVLEVNTGNVLAAATYPSYDITTYGEDYEDLVKNTASPLWNRAFMSTYAPGSTMKPGVAIAALQEGLIKRSDTVYCSSKYEYSDITLSCTDAHGSQSVVNAINYSCNIFFYEMGKRLGIDVLNKYRDAFGLGQKTGVEIEETTGIVDSPDYRQSINQLWYPGYTLQSAIGNSGDLFTPIQLANYCATIANGGTRYKCTLIKSIKTYDYSQTVWENSPTIANKTNINKAYLDLVKEGMYLVGTEGFCSAAFSSLPVKAAAKTGTSEVERTVKGKTTVCNNGFLITFAPYSNPEIAICVALEGATAGASTAPVARDIYAYYFKSQTADTQVTPDTSTDTQDTTEQETTTADAKKTSEDTLLQ